MPNNRPGEAIRKLLMTGLGTGYLPIAPGTWGSAATCVVFLAVAVAAGGKQICLTGSMLILAAVSTVICGLLGGKAEVDFGKKDPGQVTIDEWAGQAIALCYLPLGDDFKGWIIAAGTAFLAFRVFDIVKPPPVRQLEKIPGGWGIVADDLAAGVYANIAIQLILRLGLGLT